jgi:hypothetical protein
MYKSFIEQMIGLMEEEVPLYKRQHQFDAFETLSFFLNNLKIPKTE